MRSVRILLNPCRRRAFGTFKSTPESVVVEPLAVEAKSETKQAKQFSFPWRTCPEVKQGFLSNLRSVISYYLIRYWILEGAISENGEPYLVGEFIPGASHAFESTVEAIFGNEVIQRKSNKDNLSSVIHEHEQLGAIFETELSTFYHNAIKAYQVGKHQVFYQLISHGTPTIKYCDIIFNSKRGFTHKGLAKSNKFGNSRHEIHFVSILF